MKSQMRRESDQSNVVSLFGAREKAAKEAESKPKQEGQAEQEMTFEEEVRRNQEAKERMKREREKANRSVIRSYRLKT